MEEALKSNQSLREQLNQALSSKLKMEQEMCQITETFGAQEELSKLQQELDDAKTDFQEACTEILELKSSKAVLEEELIHTQNQVKVQEEKVLELEEAKRSMDNVLVELQVRLDNIKKDMEDLQSENVCLKLAVSIFRFPVTARFII